MALSPDQAREYLTIDRIDCFPAYLPMRKPLRMSSHTITRGPVLFVRVTARSGQQGWGEAGVDPAMSGETLRGMSAAIEEHLQPRVVGSSALERVAISRSFTSIYGNGSAKAALDMALVDLLGKSYGLRAVDVLGGASRNGARVLRLVGGSGDVDRDVEEALQLHEQGFRAFKLKVGVMPIAKEMVTVRRMRDAMGPGALLCADANMAWDVETAKGFMRSIREADVAFVEQPVPAGDLPRMLAVAKASHIPLCADESLHGIGDIQALAGVGAIGGVSLKTVKFGGLTNMCQAAIVAHHLGLSINLAMLVESSLASAAMVHAACAMPQLDWGVSLGHLLLSEEPIQSRLSVAGDEVRVSDAPGFGVDVSEADVRRFAPGTFISNV